MEFPEEDIVFIGIPDRLLGSRRLGLRRPKGEVYLQPMGFLRRLMAGRSFWRVFRCRGFGTRPLISQAVELAGRTVELNLPVPPPSAPAAPVAAEVKPEPLIDPRQRTREELDSLLSTLEIRTTANPDGPVEPPTTQAGIPADAAEENPIEKQKRRWLKLKLREETTETRTGPPRSPTAREDTLAALERLHQAPAMASLARSFVQITRQENVDLGEIVEVVEKDPAITARVLRMANSAMVAPASRIGDLRTAVTLLGVQRVRLTAQATAPIASECS